jgi:hypothetical protein
LEISQGTGSTGHIEARRCPFCGQEHWGIKTEEGIFIPLKAGMAVVRIGEPGHAEPGPLTSTPSPHRPSPSPDEEMRAIPWVPEALRGSRALRLKYGVFIEAPPPGGILLGGAYQSAYVDKLRRLVEKEGQTHLAVILDRFFGAAHLASGDPKAISSAMWRELDEIRRPAILMETWIEGPDASNFANLIHPRSVRELQKEEISEEALEEELNALTLEDFLDSL